MIQPAFAFATPSLEENRTRAKSIQKDIDTVEAKLEVAVEQYNQASTRLAEIQQRLTETEERLVQAQNELREGQDRLNNRLAGVYKSGQTIGMFDLIFSSESVGDLVRAVNSVEAVTEHDATIIRQVKQARREIKKAKGEIVARKKSEDGVAKVLAAKKSEIENGLKGQRATLAGVNSNIASQEQEAAAAAARLAQARESARIAQSRPAYRPASRPASGSPITPAPAPPAGDKAARVISAALAQLGKPYVWAASGPNSFDCSGLTMYVFAQVGVGLPHSAEAQFNMGRRVSKDQLLPGDLIFGANGGYISHVGIYIGNDQYVNAPQTGDVVKISRLSARSNYIGAVRLL